ncbi:uncharacterized protein LOC129013085 [Pongo pygmaeus]|uniref:uncharacterized protein LOC129013085 n=1 Tax=Pongo pygmaeus TaxID=9600 RepID=UPI0023E253E9|nr:uncharacterized protein LOC129013085 [Pongo pygmaeus]
MGQARLYPWCVSSVPLLPTPVRSGTTLGGDACPGKEALMQRLLCLGYTRFKSLSSRFATIFSSDLLTCFKRLQNLLGSQRRLNPPMTYDLVGASCAKIVYLLVPGATGHDLVLT